MNKINLTNLTFGEGRQEARGKRQKSKVKRQKAKGSHHEKISPPSMKVVTFKSEGIQSKI